MWVILQQLLLLGVQPPPLLPCPPELLLAQEGAWRRQWILGGGLCAQLPKQEGLLKLSSSPSPVQVLMDGEGSGKWKESQISSKKRSGFANQSTFCVRGSILCAGRRRFSTVCGVPSCKGSLAATSRVFSSAVLSLAFGGEVGCILLLPMKEQGCSVEAALLKPSLIAHFFHCSY